MLSAGTRISHYKIIEKIGEGGMGVVYKAEDTKLKRTVALKFLPPRLLCDSEARERFEHEAQAASALNHPNINTIYEIDEIDGRCFIAMEYLEGGSLQSRLKGRDLSIKQILELAIQIGEGLHAAHDRGVVHRDIKPDNIVLTESGLPKIMDFGLAKLKGATKVTKKGTTLGTLQYMSPEQASGQEVDHRSDIFSFGVILYEMIAGRLPFRGETEASIINSVLNDTPEPLTRYKAEVPEGVQRVVDRALEKDAGERYQHADDMVAELKHEKRLMETGASKVTQALVSGRSRRRYLRIVIPAVIAAAVILLILILEPFRIEMGPGKEASAEENSLAVMYFENMVDPEDRDRTAQMLTALLITDLSESEYLRVLSRQRLYDILSLLGKDDLNVIDKSVASQVAEEAGVQWILTGSVLQTEPSITLISEISDATTGEILASQRITAGAGEDLFSLTDRLSTRIKHGLSLPAQAENERDRPVGDVTTHSTEAYRYYLEGRDYIFKYYDVEARESLMRALEFDSTFAMAYYWLAWLTTGSERAEMIARALEYSGNASWKERQYIDARAARLSDDTDSAIEKLQSILERYPDEKQAWEVLGWIHYDNLGQYEQAASYYEKVIEIDPLYKHAYNDLAYAYDMMGDFDRSIWAINKYISLAPDEPNPYDSRGDLFRYQGNLDRAIESYGKALARKPDFYDTTGKLGFMYLFRRDYAEAESCFQMLASCPEANWRETGRTFLAMVPINQGKFGAALEVLDQGIAADRMEQRRLMYHGIKYYLKADILRVTGSYDLALREYEVAMEIFRKVGYNPPVYGRDYYVYLLTKKGDIEKAEDVTRAVKRDIEENDKSGMRSYWYASGCVAFAKADYKASVAAFEKAVENTERFWEHYLLGTAYLESGQLGEAVASFEGVVGKYGDSRAYASVFAAKTHYLLALAYERSGWNGKAIEQYEEFLDIWKDADPGISEIEDARERLTRLKGGT